MKSLSLTLRTSHIDADEAYERIRDFSRYPEFVEEVRSVVVLPQDGSDDHFHSEWEVFFRNGPLRWTEVDYFQHEQRRIVFEQTTGDFDLFRGVWSVEASDATCDVSFEATFDFGIPSMAGVLEPIASRVLKEGIAIIVYQLVGGADVIDDPDVAAAVAKRLNTAASTSANEIPA